MNVLVVTAHHDDLELSCGGTVAKLVEQGSQVTSLVMTHSGYHGLDGEVVRDSASPVHEGKRAAEVLGYRLIAYEEDTFDLSVDDKNIVRILRAIRDHNIDTILTHWHGDTHNAHRKIHTMVMHCCRTVPRVLGVAVNWYLGTTPFSPQFFVSISEREWKRKIDALQCYASEHERAGKAWVSYLDRQTRNYGSQINCERAEGFVLYKYLWDF